MYQLLCELWNVKHKQWNNQRFKVWWSIFNYVLYLSRTELSFDYMMEDSSYTYKMENGTTTTCSIVHSVQKWDQTNLITFARAYVESWYNCFEVANNSLYRWTFWWWRNSFPDRISTNYSYECKMKVNIWVWNPIYCDYMTDRLQHLLLLLRRRRTGNRIVSKRSQPTHLVRSRWSNIWKSYGRVPCGGNHRPSTACATVMLIHRWALAAPRALSNCGYLIRLEHLDPPILLFCFLLLHF